MRFISDQVWTWNLQSSPLSQAIYLHKRQKKRGAKHLLNYWINDDLVFVPIAQRNQFVAYSFGFVVHFQAHIQAI